jgi:hypothetical protein
VAGTNTPIEDKEKLLAAAKLLSIQKDVGFTFVEPEGETLKELVQHECNDREKKMAWEQREVDQ